MRMVRAGIASGVCVLGLVVLVTSQAAGAQGPPPVPQVQGAAGAVAGESAVVYVYRYKQFMGSALEPSVYLDETELARMDNGRYFAVSVSPGSHMFRANDKQSGVVLDAQPGARYFIRIEIAAGMMKGHGRVILVQPEQGRFELAKLKTLEADKVKDKDRVSLEPVNLVTQTR
jgi:hypothetical protein